MIWVGYEGNGPLSNKYGSNGKGIPHQTNVALGGRHWDVYLYKYVSSLEPHPLCFLFAPCKKSTLTFSSWPSGGHTISYLDRANSGWWSGSLTPFFNHGIANGWYTGDQYLNSVMAGWEFGHGEYTATSWGAVGF